MGIATVCCNSGEIHKKSEIIVPFGLDSELNDKINNVTFDSDSYKNINPGISIQEVYDLIISPNYYKSLLKFLFPYIIIGKSIGNLDYSDLISLYIQPHMHTALYCHHQ